ncbi:MAG: NUDIX domain-containing protein [Erysipelotrichaceae bacterium]|nr:NUDIX domain-containing protein [Erysipelotrichaceae bacterium]
MKKIPGMNCCMECGTKLIMKELKNEGLIPYCETCKDFRFPVFNTGVSMIVRHREKILLIKQYGGSEYILTAGYVNKGEDAEDAAVREIKEELGLEVSELHFNHSHYYGPSNTLMLNFIAEVTSADVRPNEEIDSFSWFTEDEARGNIRKNSLARAFLIGYLDHVYEFPDQPALPYK